ncbi:fasciclin domain-containing protein [Henriciella marina]|uniref:fasciclin domain-containing protein n=1 Tax=Henriciella marina TaxID=453851 RepID=UPI00035E6916|nr:fasciclin domain-containing protein [Henriciella marina]
MKKLFASVAATALFVGGASVAYADHHKEMSDKKDIVDTAASNDSFSTLVTAVTEAGLVDALKGDGPFTVFAPTNDAFAALPDGTVETLLMDENIDQLQAILKLHVVSGKIKSGDIAEGTTEVETLGGETIDVVNTDGTITVGGAEVIMADVYTSNGVIHAIDGVILPE